MIGSASGFHHDLYETAVIHSRNQHLRGFLLKALGKALQLCVRAFAPVKVTVVFHLGGGFLHQIPYIWTLDTTEQDSVAPLLSQLQQHSTDWAVQFIHGEKDIEADWAEYIAALEEAGLDAAYVIIRNAMERYNKR